jgi:membrane-bound lytic murein transglycosylase D
VPEILAAIIIANHPTQYGFDDITLDPPVLTDTVNINYAVDVRLVSDLVNAPVDELMALNPSLLRMATPPDTSFDLHLPAGTASMFNQGIVLIPESRRISWRYHRVVPEDTLATIAHAYNVRIADLAEANQLREDQGLSGMEALIVPVAPVATPFLRTVVYTSRRGDTLVSIADRFGVSLDQLRRWNKISSGIKVDPGRRLFVADPSSGRATAARRRGKSHGGVAANSAAHPSSGGSSSTRTTVHHAPHSTGKPSAHASPGTAPRKSSAAQREKLYAKKQKE